MKCPKCKTEIQEGQIRCSNCNFKVGSICKKCGTYNFINKKVCSKCGNELLKICPNCKSVNLPTSKTCRKCGFEFVQNAEKNINIFQKPQNKEITQNEEKEPLIINTKPPRESLKEEPVEEEQHEQQEPSDSEITHDENQPDTGNEQEEIEATEEEPISLEYSAKFYSQQKAKNALVLAIKDPSKKIISINGKSGIGKNLVLRFAISELKQQKYVWLFGKCTYVSQTSPFGLMQDILLTFFNINNFCADTQALRKNSVKFFQQDFPKLTNDEIFDLLNILYPEKTDYFENINKNKERTYNIVLKVLETISEKMPVIMVIDDIDCIDTMSYEFITKLLRDEVLMKNCKFIVTYPEIRPVMGYLNIKGIPDEAYADISIGTLKDEHIEALINQNTDIKVDENTKKTIIKIAAGVPAVAEQALMLLSDAKRHQKETEIPHTMDVIMKKRLAFLNIENTVLCKLLLVFSTLGCKFYPSMAVGIEGLSEESVQKGTERLVHLKYIVPISSLVYEFKSSEVWKLTLENARNDVSAKSTTEKLYKNIQGYQLSSASLLAVLAQNLGIKNDAIIYWNNCIKTAAYIGDVNLYVAAQKQVMKLIEDEQSENADKIRKNICTRIGKILEKNSPEEAITYLTKAVKISQEQNNICEAIELFGYIASCAKKTGNYYGIMECIDEAIKLIPPEMTLEIAMLKTRKIEALERLGNFGLLVNIVDNDIVPHLEKALTQQKTVRTIPITEVFETWIKVQLIVAKTFAIQGNNSAFDVLQGIFDLIEKNEINDELLLCKLHLVLALTNTMRGNVNKSDKILEDILKQYRIRVMDDFCISEWNLINVMNKFILNKIDGIENELFQLTTFANNIGDNYTKNILKLFLGKVFKEKNSAKKSLEIYTEQIAYFAKEQISTGVLLGWYFASESKLIEESADSALDIAMKALDIAQSPIITNYFFTCLFNKIIGEIYLIKQDFDSAKVYIEKAILLAKKFDLHDQLVKLYILYGKYHQEFALINNEDKVNCLLSSRSFYDKAGELAKQLENVYLEKTVDRAKLNLDSFCRINGIILK